jgi:hypothetical protein
MKTGRPRARALGRLDVALGPAELRAAIESLVAVHPHLRKDVARISAALSRPAIQSIAGELERELLSLDTLDLTHPRHDPFERRSDSEEVWDRLHRAVAPSVEAMVRLVQLGRPAAGLRVLQGVLLALYRVREGDRLGELLTAVPDFPDETAAWVWETWRRASRGRAPLPEAFVRDHLTEWRWLLRRRARQ